MVRLDEVDLPEVDEEQGRGEDAGGPARGMDASARPRQSGWGEGRPARRSGRSRRTAHGPAPVPARRGRRPCRDCAREWSRLAEELQHERVRLGNRIRQQLWRYYPQLLEVSDDVTPPHAAPRRWWRPSWAITAPIIGSPTAMAARWAVPGWGTRSASRL